MKNKIIKILIITMIAVVLAVNIKTAIVLKSIFDVQVVSEAASLFDKLVLTGNLIGSFVLIVFLAIVILNLAKRKNKELDKQYEAQTIIKKKEEKNKTKAESVSERKELKRNVLIKLNAGIKNINEIGEFTDKVLSNIAAEYDIMQAIFFVKNTEDKIYKKLGSYAFYSEDDIKEFSDNMGLSGQVAVNKKLLNIVNIPDNYITVLSGLGKSSPKNLLILPIVFNDESIGIIELASFHKFDSIAEDILTDFLSQIAGKLYKLNNNPLK